MNQTGILKYMQVLCYNLCVVRHCFYHCSVAAMCIDLEYLKVSVLETFHGGWREALVLKTVTDIFSCFSQIGLADMA